MRSITIRQFQQHFYAEIASLPFTVTRNGKPAFNVTTVDGFHVTTSTSKPDVTTLGVEHPVIHTKEEAVEQMKKTEPKKGLCKHGFMRGLCKDYSCNKGVWQ